MSWASFSAWAAVPWIQDLGESITLPLAIAVIAGLAIIPGYLTAYLIATLVLDRPRPLSNPDDPSHWPAVTLLVAAWNEQDRISEMLSYALAQDYRGSVRIKVIDDGSSDATAEIVKSIAAREGQVELLEVEHGGKANALNHGLAATDTELVGTIDADTLLVPEALSRLVARFMSAPEAVAAIAGAVMVRNSRANWLTRVQEWDYFLGIASIKRSQGLWQATLVAQGAFSVYETAAVKDVGGWPDMIGEDITLTWSLLAEGKTVAFEATAVAFTSVPTDLRGFARQRSRWARGMIEGLGEFGWPLLKKHNIASHGIAINFLFPWVDCCYTFAFLPGLVLACFGNFAIVGPLTLAVLPLNLLLSWLMFRLQRGVFGEMDLRIRQNRWGYLSYLLFYQPMMSPIAVSGYAKGLMGSKRRW